MLILVHTKYIFGYADLRFAPILNRVGSVCNCEFSHYLSVLADINTLYNPLRNMNEALVFIGENADSVLKHCQKQTYYNKY